MANDYLNKTCPYCKTKFVPEDEIVLCSACEMPHHKECWVENQGCTTFGCLGTIKSADNGAPSVTATQMIYEEPKPAEPPRMNSLSFCTRCGIRIQSTDAFCTRCGTPRAPVAAATFCTRCGTRHTGAAAFCTRCGNRLNATFR